MSDLLAILKDRIEKESEYLKYTFIYDLSQIEKWHYNPVRLNI